MTTGDDAAACDDAYVSTVIAKVTRCGARVRERATWIGFRRLHPTIHHHRRFGIDPRLTRVVLRTQDDG